MNPAESLTPCALIDLDAVTHNVSAIREHIGPGVAMMAVVKANAYGHGALPVARTALAAGAAWLAVARVDEGVQLRQAGLQAPILVMGYAAPAEAGAIVRYGLTAAIYTSESAAALSAQAQAAGRVMPVHLKIDSGMGRAGLLPAEAAAFAEALRGLPGLDLEGAFTHFAAADSADPAFTRRQLAVFEDVLAALRGAGHAIRLRHAANSAAALELPAAHLDAVRVGIALYGLRPSLEVPPAVALRPALSLITRIARLRTLPAGASIGYGRSYVARAPIAAALTPLGYGDGYPRALSNAGEMLVRGQRARVVGRVSMDQTVLDVTRIPGAAEGDEVVVIGAQGDDRLTAEEVAAAAGTINYEIVTGLMPRLPRVYVQGGRVIEVSRLAEP